MKFNGLLLFLNYKYITFYYPFLPQFLHIYSSKTHPRNKCSDSESKAKMEAWNTAPSGNNRHDVLVKRQRWGKVGGGEREREKRV